MANARQTAHRASLMALLPSPENNWRARFYADTRAREDKVTEYTLRKRFNRAILDLTGKQVETMGEWFWLA